MSRRLFVTAVPFLASLAACGPSNAEAKRHVVIAELIQSRKVPGCRMDIT